MSQGENNFMTRLAAFIVDRRRWILALFAALLAFSAFPELKHVILVDEDVDIFDTNDVLWAMNTRFQGDADIITIPGVPAFAAIASQIGAPIVEGDDVLAVIPATASPDKIQNALAAADNVVMMKVYKNFSDVAHQLSAHGLAKNAVLVSRAGLDGEQVIDDIMAHRDEKLNYLSTILTRRH